MEAERQAEVERNRRRDARLALRDTKPPVASGTGPGSDQEQSASEIAALKVELSDSDRGKASLWTKGWSELRKENELDKHEPARPPAPISRSFRWSRHRNRCSSMFTGRSARICAPRLRLSTPASTSCCRMSGCTGWRRPGCARPEPAPGRGPDRRGSEQCADTQQDEPPASQRRQRVAADKPDPVTVTDQGTVHAAGRLICTARVGGGSFATAQWRGAPQAALSLSRHAATNPLRRQLSRPSSGANVQAFDSGRSGLRLSDLDL